METNLMEHHYQQIAITVNNMIPEDWDKVLLYAEVTENYRKVFFYYYPENKTTPIYSLDLVDHFQMDEDEFEQLDDHLYQLFVSLHAEFNRSNQEPWTNLTFFLESTGAFKVEYGYEDLSNESPIDVQTKWEAKHLGV